MNVLNKNLASSAIASLCCSVPDYASANPLNQWRVSCGVDRGAYEKRGKTHYFRTSSNHCPGGTFNQRSEIYTRNVTPKHKGTYVFSSTIAMHSNSRERFDVFQIHDERYGCAPPLKLEVHPDGRLSLDSAYKLGSEPGDNCVPNRSLNGKFSQSRIKRDGTSYDLEVTVSFDGTGGFELWISLDDVQQIAGYYAPPDDNRFFNATKYYFKHGVYSKNVFQYELTSKDMRVRRVRLK